MSDTVSMKFPLTDDLAMATQVVILTEAEETLTVDTDLWTMTDYYVFEHITITT